MSPRKPKTLIERIRVFTVFDLVRRQLRLRYLQASNGLRSQGYLGIAEAENISLTRYGYGEKSRTDVNLSKNQRAPKDKPKV
jgi:hypothetical protein